mmetsp:Transcript_27006/g.30913  ORF Transcript_27006/g.30913 Transcript_27006/m.30913 type:complete len:223 (-) Transcript_27006:5-673(-)
MLSILIVSTIFTFTQHLHHNTPLHFHESHSYFFLFVFPFLLFMYVFYLQFFTFLFLNFFQLTTKFFSLCFTCGFFLLRKPAMLFIMSTTVLLVELFLRPCCFLFPWCSCSCSSITTTFTVTIFSFETTCLFESLFFRSCFFHKLSTTSFSECFITTKCWASCSTTTTITTTFLILFAATCLPFLSESLFFGGSFTFSSSDGCCHHHHRHCHCHCHHHHHHQQ